MSDVRLYPLNKISALSKDSDKAILVVTEGTGSESDAAEISDAIGAAAVTAASIASATETMSMSQAATMRLGISCQPSNQDRLSAFRGSRDALRSTTGRIGILVLGDSMVGTARTEIYNKIRSEFGIAGELFLTAGVSRTEMAITNDCTKWISGNFTRLSQSGDIVEFGRDGAGFVEGNVLSLYYNRAPGGGVFKIQSQKSGGSWTDEVGYTSVNADGVLAGQVVSITKTDWRASWKIRAVWVSGGPIDIIGGGVVDSLQAGTILAYCENSSQSANNLPDMAATPRAITDPILAAIAPHLVVLSHLDGADAVNSSQATLQDNVLAGIATNVANRVPSWLIIGPPCGFDSASDSARAAQQSAMQTLADSRGDAFFDNRGWALPVSSAMALGYLVGADPHYTAAARNNWVASMWSSLGLSHSSNASERFSPAIQFVNGGVIRPAKATYDNTRNGVEVPGNLWITGTLISEDSSGPTGILDRGTITYSSGSWRMRMEGDTADLAFGPGTGFGHIIQDFEASAASPRGELGGGARPWNRLNLGKTVAAAGTTGVQTIHKTAGSVNFAAGDASKVVTCNMYVAPVSAQTGSIVIATVRTNDATMKSVAVVGAANGAFTLHANAAPTGEVRVDWFIATP